MSARTEIRRDQLSPSLVAILGLLLLAATVMVDLATDPTAAYAAESAAAEEPAG